MSDSLLKNKIIICYWWSQSLEMLRYVTNVCILCYSFKRPGVSCQMKSLISISSLLKHAFSIACCLIFGVSEIDFYIPRLNIRHITFLKAQFTYNYTRNLIQLNVHYINILTLIFFKDLGDVYSWTMISLLF